MGILRRFSPELLQTSVPRSRGFEGWYFKLAPPGLAPLAFIPGASGGNDPHAFVQVIGGPDFGSRVIRCPADAFAAVDQPFAVQVGASHFGSDGIELDLADGDWSLRGRVRFGELSPYPSGFLRPGIMGPFGLLGFLECYHGVLSADHAIDGELTVRDARGERHVSLAGGRGYWEKDWGRSFPKDYVWLQANSFAEEGVSVFASLADIPFKIWSFPGLIAFVRLPERGFITFATWNGARVERLSASEGRLAAVLRQGRWRLELEARHGTPAPLAAPADGAMGRTVRESVDGCLEFSLFEATSLRATGVSASTGFETGGDPDNLARRFGAAAAEVRGGKP